MMRNRRPTWTTPACLMAIIAGLTVSGLAIAAKPTKPGDGGETVPPGTLYFSQGEYPFTSRSMQADGSGKTNSIEGEPTYQLHDGLRWFLTSRDITTDPAHSEYEILVVSSAGDILPLNLVVANHFGSRWAKDDTFLSIEAIVEVPEGRSAGVFRAAVDWSLGLPVIGEAEKVLNVNLVDDYPETYFGDWSPLGDEYVYVREESDELGGRYYSLEIVTVFSDGTTESRSLISDSFGYAPQWSPDGSRIAYQGSGGIWSIRSDGTGAVKLTSTSSTSGHYDPNWSPDSQYLIFTQSTRNRLQKGDVFYTYSYDIFRITATGSGQTNLTGDTAENCFGIAWR